MTVFRRRPLALAIAVSLIFSFAAQRLGFTSALRLVWLSSGVLCALAFLLLALIKTSSRQALTGLALISLTLFISFFSAQIFFSSRIEPARRFAEENSAKKVVISGEVTRVYDGMIVVRSGPDAAVGLYKLDEPPFVREGDIVRAEATIDAGPDLVSDSLWSQGVYIKATAQKCEVTGKAEPDLIKRIKTSLTEAFSPLRTPGIAQAMTYGVRGAEEDTLRGALSASGTAHLLSVSGLHVSLVLFAAVKLLERVGAGPKTRAAALTAVAAVYLSLIGFIPSALRAAIMTSLYYLARALRRDSDPLTSLAVCVFAITCADPGAFKSVSFLLSAAATLGVIRVSIPLTESIFSSPKFKSSDRFAAFFLACARDALCGAAVTFGAVSFSLPLMMGLSRTFNALAPIANLALGALFPVVIAPLFVHSAAFCLFKLASVPSLAAPGAKVCDLFLFVFEKTAVFLSGVSASQDWPPSSQFALKVGFKKTYPSVRILIVMVIFTLSPRLKV